MGATVPEVTMRNLRGGEITLSEYRGRRLFLVFSDPGCPGCDEIMHWLEHKIHREPKNVLDVLLVSRGSPAYTWGKVQQYGLTMPVGLQRHWEVSEALQASGTPGAYAIGANGKTEAEYAGGVQAVTTLGGWMAYG